MSSAVTSDLLAAAEDLVRRELASRAAHHGDDWRAVWKTTAAAGWFDTLLPEKHGGLGLGVDTAAKLFELIGRWLIAGPYLDHLVVVPTVYPYMPASARVVLDRARGGDEVVVLADLAATADLAQGIQLSGTTLTGRVNLVRYGEVATAFLVVTTDANSAGLALVETSLPGVSINPRRSFDAVSPVADVCFDGVTVPDDAIVSTPAGGAATALIERVRTRARLMLAAELSGLCRHLLGASTSYALDRRQFGRPIGSFPPVQQILADMATQLAGLEAFVADHAAHTEPDPLDALLLKGLASQIARRVGEAALQVHGGIAFTEEFHDNRWFLRILSLQATYGDQASNFVEAGRTLLGSACARRGERAR